MRSNQCFQIPSEFKQECFWPSDMPPFPLVPGAPLGPLMFPSCQARSNRSKDLTGTEVVEAVVMGAGLCDDEGERAHTVYDLILGGERLVWCS